MVLSPKEDALWHCTVIKLGLAGTEAPRELLVDCVATSGRLTPARGEDDLGPSLLNNLLQALEAVTAEELRLGTCEDRVKDTIHVEKDYFIVLVGVSPWGHMVSWAKSRPGVEWQSRVSLT